MILIDRIVKYFKKQVDKNLPECGTKGSHEVWINAGYECPVCAALRKIDKERITHDSH